MDDDDDNDNGRRQTPSDEKSSLGLLGELKMGEIVLESDITMYLLKNTQHVCP